MTEYKMPDLTEFNEATGLEWYWYIDQDFDIPLHGAPRAIAGSIEVSLKRDRPTKWWQRGDVRTARIDRRIMTLEGVREHRNNLNDGRVPGVSLAEATADAAVRIAEKILAERMKPYRYTRTDVNGLTGARFSERIKHSGSAE